MNRVILASVLGFGLAGAVQADPVEGIWKTAEGEEGGYLHVEIAPCGSAICGTINNAFKSSGDLSADYEHLGKQIIWNMLPDEEGYYSGGKIWAPDSDKTYRSKMALEGDSLTVKGCVAGGLICRGQVWTRIK
ncbi:imidazoleglycerol-phosphate dehydratase [Ruegeria marisrubri]|uniref:Imidazoleglycerol-phosphate dehydratase n=1 Tax=Ruegeria marisrubri TaxID=1685379 RepID=A0A0X3TQX9_9RHOB|nr:DUF2147 domain-containing protein [Ruegeria marisrubri]KUJ76856.1 imidazoleglycerol-phosphate dehydratase [Ruegeria marisrubri]